MFEQICLCELLYQLALFDALRASRIAYHGVAGVSLGDLAASYAAGATTFDETVHVTCEVVAAVMAATGGDLVVVYAPSPAAQLVLGELALQPVIDSPRHSVWAVPDNCFPLFERRMGAANASYTRLEFGCLPHTSQVDRLQLERALAGLPARTPSIPFYASASGGRVVDRVDAAFWARMCSQPALYAGMLDSLLAGGYDEIVVVGTERLDDMVGGANRTGSAPRLVWAQSLLDQGAHSGDAGRARPSAASLATATSTPVQTPDLTTREFARDPYAHFRAWRAHGGVQRLAAPDGWLVLGHVAVRAVLTHPELYSSAPFRSFFGILHGADAPEHTRIRDALKPFFSTARLSARAASIRQHTEAAIEALRARETFDLVADLANPLPFAITCAWLGLEPSAAASLLGVPPAKHGWDAIECMLHGDGLIRELATTSELSRDEVAELTPFLLTAGHTTISDFLGLTGYTLLRFPEVAQRVRADPSLVPSLVNELLRFEPPVQSLMRRTRAAVTLEGQSIPAESTIWVSLAAANRDPACFDDPDTLRLERDATRHVSFGSGPHFCLGSHLGRIELVSILRALFCEAPPLRSVDALDDVEFEGHPIMRHVKSLRVAFAR